MDAQHISIAIPAQGSIFAMIEPDFSGFVQQIA
jgi:hypothetical protein